MNNCWVVLAWITGAWAEGVWAGDSTISDNIHEVMDMMPRTRGARAGRVRR